MKFDITFSPAMLPEQYEGEVCAVIDILRATTTIAAAMASGAAEIRPCINADAARREVASLPGGYLLGGEEGGYRIPGFDLGNSPLEYTDSRAVEGKPIAFATTNGTPALKRAYHGSRLPIFIAALVNASAVSAAIVALAEKIVPDGINLVCSGRHGRPSQEDIFGAGVIGGKVLDGLERAGIACGATDAARVATQYAQVNERNALEVLAGSEHGRYLKQIGFAADIEFASQIDEYDVVPIFDGARIIASR
jgi:2-phosphosulfolactate phosphatase